MGAEELIQQAEEALRSGRAEEALSLARRALGQGVSRTTCLRVQASALVRLGRTTEAEPVLNELIDLRPDDPWAYAELARLQLAAGRAAKAEALLGRAVQFAPNDPTLRSDLERVRQMGSTRGPQRKKRSALVWVIAGVVGLLLIAALTLWARGMLLRPAEPPVQAAVPQPAPEPQVTQPVPEPPPQPAVAQTIPEPAAQPEVNQAPPPLPPAPKVVAVPAELPPPPAPPPPPKEPTARVLWLRCQEVPQLEFRGEGRVRRVYQMWGEVLNESDQPLPVAVVRGALLYGSQAAGYGLSEVQNVPPGGRAGFNFYSYQLGLEGAAKPNAYDAMVIPGFQISQAFKDLGAYGTMLEQLLMGSGGI